MKKMYIIFYVIAVIILATAVLYFLKNNKSTNPTARPTIMTSDLAYQYVKSWADFDHVSIGNIKPQPNGDFYGQLGTLYFQFNSNEKELKVYARVVLDLDLSKYPDVEKGLDQIATQQPEKVNGAQFVSYQGPWADIDKTLYLVKVYTNPAILPKDMLSDWQKLSDTAYLWHRTYFRQVVDPIVQKRLQN